MIFDEKEHVFIEQRGSRIISPKEVQKILESYQDDEKDYEHMNKYITRCMKRIKSPDPYTPQEDQNVRMIDYEINNLKLSSDPIYVCNYCLSYGNGLKKPYFHLKECVAAAEADNEELEVQKFKQFRGYSYRVGRRLYYLCIKDDRESSQSSNRDTLEVELMPNSNDVKIANSVIFEKSTNLFIEKDSGVILNPFLNEVDEFFSKKRSLRGKIDSILELVESCVQQISSPNYYEPDDDTTVTLLGGGLRYCRKQQRNIFVCRSCERIAFPRGGKAAITKAKEHLSFCNKSCQKSAITMYSGSYDLSVAGDVRRKRKHHLVVTGDFKRFITLEQFEQPGPLILTDSDSEEESGSDLSALITYDSKDIEEKINGIPIINLETSSESSDFDDSLPNSFINPPKNEHCSPRKIGYDRGFGLVPTKLLGSPGRSPSLHLSGSLSGEQSEDDGYLGDDGIEGTEEAEEPEVEQDDSELNALSHKKVDVEESDSDIFYTPVVSSDDEHEQIRNGNPGNKGNRNRFGDETGDLEDFQDFDFGSGAEVLSSNPIRLTPPRVPMFYSSPFRDTTRRNILYSSPRQNYSSPRQIYSSPRQTIDEANKRFKRSGIQLIPINRKKPRTDPEGSFLAKIPLMPSSSRLSESEIETSSDEELVNYLLSSHA